MTETITPADEGRIAGRHGEPRSACPWSPSSPEGIAWCRSWTEATGEILNASGQMAADTEHMKAEANAATEFDPAYRVDPCLAILGVDEQRPPATLVSIGVSFKPLIAKMTEVSREFDRVMERIADATAWSRDEIATWVSRLEEVHLFGVVDSPKPVNREQRRHGRAASCPRHGDTTGGLCRPCARGR